MMTYDHGTYNIQKDAKWSFITGLIVVIIIIALVAFSGCILCHDYGITCTVKAKDAEYDESVKTVQRLTQKEIKRLKGQNIFADTKSVREAYIALDSHDIVAIKGRYGTGKSTIALQLASDLAEIGFKPYKFKELDIDAFKYLMKSKRKRIIILENIFGDILQRDVELREWKELILFLFQFITNTKLIITTCYVNQDLKQVLSHHIDKSQDIYIDLDDNKSLDVNEKKLMLEKYYAKHNRLSTDNIDTIAQCNPVVGFPLMYSLFCGDDSNFSMGVSYFLQPTIPLIEQIEKLKKLGFNAELEAIKYSVLVYVSLSITNIVSVHRDHVNLEFFKTIYREMYKRDYKSNKELIQNSASGFREIFFDMNESGDCVFRNPDIRQAVQISYGKNNQKLVIENALLEDLLIILRPENYKSFPKVSIVEISKNNSDLYETFAQRIAAECIQTCGIAEKVGVYLNEYTVKPADFKLLELVLGQFKAQARKSKDRQYIPSLITIFQKITNHSTNCLPVLLPPIDFRLTWEIICAAKNGNTDTVLQLFENSKTTETICNVLFSVADEYGNTLLHYFVVWGYNAGLLFLENIKESTELKKNNFGFSAIHFAAVLARPVYLRMLLKLNKTTEESILLKLASKLLNKIRKQETLTANQIAFFNFSSLVKEGESRQGQNVPLTEQTYLNIDKHITSSVTFGQQGEYDSAIKIVEEFYKQV